MIKHAMYQVGIFLIRHSYTAARSDEALVIHSLGREVQTLRDEVGSLKTKLAIAKCKVAELATN